MMQKLDSRFDRYAFASPIKNAVNGIMGWDSRHSDGILKEVIDPRIGKSPRQLYQTLGTEWGRSMVYDRIWVMLGEERYHKSGFLIISDVRFPNEVEMVKKNGGIIVHVSNPTAEQNTVGGAEHASEAGITHLLDPAVDPIISNTSTLETLMLQVETKFDRMVTEYGQ
jgi:hypothetical protein